MRIWIAGGGTGGHVYPGLAVVQALAAKVQEAGGGKQEVLYVGGKGGVEERLAERAGLRFVGVPAGGVHGLSPWRAAWNFIKLMRGCWAVYRLGRSERPAALFATGGYASVPVALTAWMLQTPILVYLPDIEPGLAVRFIARLATRVAVTVDDSHAYFTPFSSPPMGGKEGGKVVTTGYPVRAEFHDLDRAGARAALGLRPDGPDGNEPVLLVMGGSQGARSINQALSGVLEQILELAQVIHVSGELDWLWVAERRDGLAPELQTRYHAFPYLHEVGSAMVAADLAVCRAGASTLGELPFFSLPALLVPYPHAQAGQRVNAEWLAGRGAALQLDDERLSEELLPTVRRLFGDRATLEEMSKRMATLARPGAAARLAEELYGLV